MHLSTQVARLATALALAAAFAGITTPGARASHQDLGPRVASHYSGQASTPDAFDRYLRSNAPSASRPDDRAGIRGVGALTQTDTSDAFSRYLANNGPDVAPDEPASEAIDWSTAGLGAGGMLGVLLLARALQGVRGHRSRLAAR